MTRKLRTADYEATLNLTVTLREALPPNHLARFVADVIAQLDLASLYARYAPVGGEAIAPEILLGLLFYGYATGVFSSRIMKNSRNDGFDQHYNVQVATDQDSLLIVAAALSNHANDQQEVEPTLDALPAQLGSPEAAALDHGYFSSANVAALEQRGIEAYIAPGREAHHPSWRAFFGELPPPPAPDASLKVKMAYKLQTEVGQAIYRLRQCTVEPVIGVIKEVLGFRQFSLRGLAAAAGEWCLVCLAFNLKRLHRLMAG